MRPIIHLVVGARPNYIKANPVFQCLEELDKFDLVLVDMSHALASVDSRMPNALVAESVANGYLPQFSGYAEVSREVTFGDSRLDLMLGGSNGRCYIEAKSVTLVEKGVG